LETKKNPGFFKKKNRGLRGQRKTLPKNVETSTGKKEPCQGPSCSRKLKNRKAPVQGKKRRRGEEDCLTFKISLFVTKVESAGEPTNGTPLT